MKCCECGYELSGGSDTFGERGREMCLACYLRLDDEMDEPWYGLGPHVHSFGENGKIVIGGTQFTPLPEPAKDGRYRIGAFWFEPDPGAPGCGIWSRT